MPDKIFSEEERKKLDSNIRKMISDGLGQEDIDAYVKVFKEKAGRIAGPSAPSGPVMPSTLPTFQEQMPMMQTNRFTEAVRQDKKKSGSYIGAIHDSFVSAIDPIMYAGDELFIDSYEFLSGKKLDAATKKGIRTTAETIRQVAPFAGPKKTQDKEYVQEVQGGWDMRDGFGVKDLKALGLMGSRVAGDLAIATAAQSVGVPMGSTYFIQGVGSGYQEYNEMVDKGIVPEDKTAKNAYALTTGVINGLLEKLAFDKIFGSGPAFTALKKKVTGEVLKQVSKSTAKVTVDTIEKTGEQLLRKELSGLGRKAQRAGFAAGVESLTEGGQTFLEEGAKVLTNAIQGQDIFDENDIYKNLGWNVFNASVAGGLLGAPMGIANTMMTNVDNTLVKEIANAKNETELNKIIQELEQSMKDSNASEEEIDAMRQSAVKYNDISKTIPQSATPEAKANIIGLIDRRNGIDEKMTNWQAELEQIDESMRPDVEAEMNTLVDAKDMINDEIRENAAGGKFKYFEDKGKFFKQFENTDPVEISKSRFELQNVKDNATPKSQEQVQESGPSSDISQPEGTQVVEDQAPDESNVGYRYIVSEEGDEVPIAALVNKKVRINGEPAILYKEGRRIVARVLGTNRILDTFGTEAEMMNALPEQFGIEVDETVVSETPSGYRVEGQDLRNQNENPMDAISYDQNGKVMNVVLTTPAGKRRKFRGAVAQDLAYQITLKEALKNEDDFEAFLEQEYEQELENARLQAAAQEQAAPAAEPVPEPAQAEEPAQPAVQPDEEFLAPIPDARPTYGRITAYSDDSRPVKGKLAKKLVADAKRVLNSIKNLGDFSVNIHDQESFERAVFEATGSAEFAASRGFYITSNGEIHINIDNAAPDTVLHEGFHPILDFMAQSNPQVVNDLFNELSAIPEAAGIIEMVNEQYDGEMTQKKEAITNFVAGVANGDIVVNPSNFAKIRRFIANLLKKLGLPIEPKVLLDVNNPTKLVELSKFISEVFETGDIIVGGQLEQLSNLGDFEEKIPTNEEPIARSGQLQFQKTIYDKSGIEKSPALDAEEYRDAVNNGRISVVNPYQSLKDKFFAITFPDDFFTGEIKFNGDTIAFGNGGVFFAAKHGERGDVWAAAGENSANNFVIQGNESLRKNNGEGIIVLSKGEDIKQSTSLEANIAFINTIIKYAGSIKELDGVIKGIKTAYSVGKAKSADSIIESFNQYLAAGRGESGQRMVDAKQAFNVMSSGLIKEAGPTITRMFRDMGFEGDTYFNKTKLKNGEYVATTQGLKAMFIDMLQEDFLKGLNNGAVYSALKFNSPIKFEKDLYHPSYPYVIKTIDGSPVRLEVFNKTFNSYGKDGVAIYGQDRNKENAFGVATTTKPDFKLDPTFEDNPAQKNIGGKLDAYSALKPQFQKATPTKETRKGVTVKGKEIVSPKVKAKAQNLFTSSGVLGQAIRTFKEQMGGELTAEMKIAERSTNEVLKLMEKYKGVISTQDIDNYLTGNATTKQFPLDLATKLTEMRVHIDGLTGRLIDLGVITAEESKALYENNKGRYMLRSYELFNRKDKGVVTIDNVTKRLKNVDQAKVDKALDFLEKEIAKENPNLTKEELRKEAISQANSILSDEDMSFGGRNLEGSLNTKSLSQRSEYLDKSPAIRELMGEYTDPVYRYYSSIFKLAGLTSERAYLNNLKAEGMGKFLFEKPTGEAVVRIEKFGKRSKAIEPLGGLYTYPEIHEALLIAEREKAKLYETILGHVRIMKTVYNPATHVKNVLGSLAFSIANGHWLYAGKAFSYIKKANRAKLIELIDILNREGVLNNNIGAGELNQYFDKFADVNSVLSNINSNANKSALSYLGGKAANLKKIPNALKKAYAIEDDIFKVLGFVNEANMYAKAEYGVEYDALTDTQRAAINKLATEHVKSFYPTFSRVPKFVKKFSKAAFLGNFLSFPVESVRVSYNTIAQGVKEVRSDNPKIKAIGVNRLAGSLLYNMMISALPIFAAMASGDDDDKEEGYGGLTGYLFDTEEQKKNRLNSQLYRAPWNKQSNVLTTKFSEGKLVYSDIGSIDSYGYQREVWSTFWDNLSDKKGFNKAMAATLGRTISPFIDIDMTVSMFANLLENKDESGNMIANLELPWEKRVPDYGMFVLKKVAPGAVNSLIKGYNYYQAGEMDKVSAELASQLVRTYNVDIKKSFQNYVYASPYEENTERTGFKKRLDNAEMIYTKIKNSKYISPEEKEEQYKMAVDAYKKVLMDTNKYYEAAVASGVDASELTRILMNAKLGDQRGGAEVLSIVQNRYDFPDEVYIRR